MIWLHAASMGEVAVLAVLADHLRRRNKDVQLYITVMTETGYDRARELLPDDVALSFFPIDYRSPIRRFLKKIKPAAVVFIETEIWPNWIMKLHRLNIPIVLANGRLSEKSARSYARFGNSMRMLMSLYGHIIVQSDDNRERFISIGADDAKIIVGGSLKFDAPVRFRTESEKRTYRAQLPFKTEARIWICGSTRNGEHEQLLDVYINLKKKHPSLKMILVPRHLEKIEDIVRMIGNVGLMFVQYTEMKNASHDTDVLLVDQIGCLNDLYPLSDIAFVGGTLVEIGGHNLLEPVWAGVPVLFGPHIANVKESADYVKKGQYGLMVNDKKQLEAKLDLFLSGRLEFASKADDMNGTSGAAMTAKIILSLLQK